MPKKWACSSCTLHNTMRRKLCEACGERRTADAQIVDEDQSPRSAPTTEKPSSSEDVPAEQRDTVSSAPVEASKAEVADAAATELSQTQARATATRKLTFSSTQGGGTVKRTRSPPSPAADSSGDDQSAQADDRRSQPQPSAEAASSTSSSESDGHGASDKASSAPPPFTLEFASGRAANPSKAAMAKAAQILGTADDEPRGAGAYESAPANPPPFELSFASGRAAKPSAAAMKRAAQVLGLSQEAPTDGECVSESNMATHTSASSSSSSSSSASASEARPPQEPVSSGSRAPLARAPAKLAGSSVALPRPGLGRTQGTMFRAPGLRNSASLHPNVGTAAEDRSKATSHEKSRPTATTTAPLRPSGGNGARRSFKAPKAAEAPAVTSEGTAPSAKEAPTETHAALRQIDLPFWAAGIIDADAVEPEAVFPIAKRGLPAAEVPLQSVRLAIAEATEREDRILELFPEAAARPLRVEDFVHALTTLGCSRKWATVRIVGNALRHTIWNLCCAIARAEGGATAVQLTPMLVLSHLLLRYNDEYVDGRRSAFRQISEKDAVASATLVVVVGGIVSRAAGASRVEVSDGYYTLTAVLDGPLSLMLHHGHLEVGQKLVACGASYSGTDGMHPLDVTDAMTLSLSFNGCRPAQPNARLGFATSSQMSEDSMMSFVPVVPAEAIHLDGGAIPSVRGVVLRVLPPVYMERRSEGGRITRNRAAEHQRDDAFQDAALKRFEDLRAVHGAEAAGRMLAEGGMSQRDVSASVTLLMHDGTGLLAVQVWRHADAFDGVSVGDTVRLFQLMPNRYQRTRPPLDKVKLLVPVKQPHLTREQPESMALETDASVRRWSLPTSVAAIVDELETQADDADTTVPLRGGDLVTLPAKLVKVDSDNEAQNGGRRWLLTDGTAGRAAILFIPAKSDSMEISLSPPAAADPFVLSNVMFDRITDYGSVTCVHLTACEYSCATARPAEKAEAQALKCVATATGATSEAARRLLSEFEFGAVAPAGVPQPQLPLLAADEGAPATASRLPGERRVVAEPPGRSSGKVLHPLYGGGMPVRASAASVVAPTQIPVRKAAENAAVQTSGLGIEAQVQATPLCVEAQVQTDFDVPTRGETKLDVLCNVAGSTVTLNVDGTSVALLARGPEGPLRRMIALRRAPGLEETPDAASVSDLWPDGGADAASALQSTCFISCELTHGGRTDSRPTACKDHRGALFADFHAPDEASVLCSTDEAYTLHTLRLGVIARLRRAFCGGNSDGNGCLWMAALKHSAVLPPAVWNNLAFATAANPSQQSAPDSPDRLEMLQVTSSLCKVRRWNSSDVAPRDTVWWHESEWQELRDLMERHFAKSLFMANLRGTNGELSLRRALKLGELAAEQLYLAD